MSLNDGALPSGAVVVAWLQMLSASDADLRRYMQRLLYMQHGSVISAALSFFVTERL